MLHLEAQCLHHCSKWKGKGYIQWALEAFTWRVIHHLCSHFISQSKSMAMPNFKDSEEVYIIFQTRCLVWMRLHSFLPVCVWLALRFWRDVVFILPWLTSALVYLFDQAHCEWKQLQFKYLEKDLKSCFKTCLGKCQSLRPHEFLQFHPLPFILTGMQEWD